ncbi:MAG: sulfatase [Bacteroidetes bacterium]|nr:sulfatase [Bacteroidota bacterium]
MTYLFLLVLPFFTTHFSDLPTQAVEHANILFLIADDWSYPHAGIYGDKVVRTPTFDHLAEKGAVFHNAFTATPSCSPSRAAILTGQYPHRLGEMANLWSIFSEKYPNYVSLLEKEGYFTGSTRKGWAPGNFKKGGYDHNPAEKKYGNFRQFFQEKPNDKPFCFWFGSTDPHRAYDANTGIQAGMNIEDVEVPGFLPDKDCVRNDILDYYYEVERFDRDCGEIIRFLKDKGELANTLIVMTSDNGMPFPRAKANLYDYGTRMPLAIYWKGKIQPGKVIHEFVNFVDFAPTFLHAANSDIPQEMSGNSLLPLLKGEANQQKRDRVFVERERHANVRKGDLSYPCRAVRTDEYLYIRNFEEDRHPAGDPETHQSVGQYGDVDNSISKFLIMATEDENNQPDLFQLAFGKRPEEELYDVAADPFQLNNLAEKKESRKILKKMRASLKEWMAETNDLRSKYPKTTFWDEAFFVPEYQFHNYDLKSKIDDYSVQPTRKATKIKCLH